jgi:hypothetical protein
MNSKNLLTSVSLATMATLSLSLSALACGDPSDSFNTAKLLGNISPTSKLLAKIENGCFVNSGSDLIKIIDSVGSTSMTGGASSSFVDKADIFRFIWTDSARSVKLSTNGAQIRIYKDLGGGQKQLLVGSTQFLSNLSFSVAQNSSYFFEFYNSTLNGANSLYTGTMN